VSTSHTQTDHSQTDHSQSDHSQYDIVVLGSGPAGQRAAIACARIFAILEDTRDVEALLIVELDGLEANCEVLWRTGNDMGVKFLAAPRIVATKRAQVVEALVQQKTVSLRRKPREMKRLIKRRQTNYRIGENGAGKSTLLHIVSANLKPDAGSVFVRGSRATFHNPREANLAGIFHIYQELALVPLPIGRREGTLFERPRQ